MYLYGKRAKGYPQNEKKFKKKITRKEAGVHDGL